MSILLLIVFVLIIALLLFAVFRFRAPTSETAYFPTSTLNPHSADTIYEKLALLGPPIHYPNVYLRHGASKSPQYLTWERADIDTITGEQYHKIVLSDVRDEKNRFTLHFFDIAPILNSYYSFFRNSSPDKNFAKRHRLDKVVYVTSEYNPKERSFLEIIPSSTSGGCIVRKRIHMCGSYGNVGINPKGELAFDGRGDYEDAYFEIETENPIDLSTIGSYFGLVSRA